ncbi:MAG: class I SAM-dependent DNA methyltransferase [Pyrinomonadaceae bacterium]
MTTGPTFTSIQEFIKRWKESGAAERANYQLFLSELTDLLEVLRPQPTQTDDEQNAYVFERAVIFNNGDGTTSTGRIDLYKRGCFVLEAKQGSDRVAASVPLFGAESDLIASRGRYGRKGMAVRGTSGWDVAMRVARGQAEQYVRALPLAEENPPFVVVVDVGHSFELYSDFSRAGRTYLPFPDARSYRISLDDLARDDVRERLRLIWTDPLALDPSRRTARVTREMAERLADLAHSLEQSGHSPERVANFLMRAIFTMFAEDVKLLPPNKWTELLESLHGEVAKFPAMVSSLWETMNAGGFSPIMRENLLRFNGGLFETFEALPITERQLDLLIAASKSDWGDVEPAIFGTLLERALDPLERQLRGAHFTPRAYVERLVMPTVIEPLREEWGGALAAAITLAQAGKLKEAAEEVKLFHRRLCRVRVLDPACGSGNFLYVTLEHMKRLEGEVLDALHGFGEKQGILEDAGMTVDPHQLLGIEKNPRATAISDLVLWIGYLQWHFRTRGEANPPEPVIRKFHNIECRDAVLAYDAEEVVTDESGKPVTRWDGRSFKKHPVTQEEVPDETARTPLLRYVNARKADWPEADFIVGNPPFIGNSRMRSALGDGYTETLRHVYGHIPESSDYVMYWWDRAAELARGGQTKRFGLIATNSLRQTFNRRVLEKHMTAKDPVALVFAVPDHPWVDGVDGANVRISMTVGEAGNRDGVLSLVVRETEGTGEAVEVELSERRGKILSDLTIGANVGGSQTLRANERLSNRGVVLHGAGFIVTPEEATQLGLGRVPGLENHIRHYLNGRDITSVSRNVMVIDLFGLNIEEVRANYPEVYQWVYERVKPERDHNNRPSRRDNWWIFGEPISTFRPALADLRRYIATVETSKHRFFVFLDRSILPDNKLVNIAVDDAYFLGLLSSRAHVTWALAAGSHLGVGNDPVYVKTACFERFPFPNSDDSQKERIRTLGEQLDAHRKRQQELHPHLTITDMYNVLEKLRTNEPLNDKDLVTNDDGLISILLQIQDDLDAAVFQAYGWPVGLSDEEVLGRLVQLNSERVEEERTGTIRWLRPEYQKPTEGVAAAFGTDVEGALPAAKKTAKLNWPKTIPEQARAVRQALTSQVGAVTPKQLAKNFSRAKVERVEELLQTLVSLGQARETEEGHYVA